MRYVIVRQRIDLSGLRWRFTIAQLLIATGIAAVIFWAVRKDAKTLEIEAEYARLEKAVSQYSKANGPRPYPPI
jgi:hypothetical protein